MQVREPLLGTRGEVAVVADVQSTAVSAELAAIAEVERLEAIFTVFDLSSSLHALRATGTTDVAELAEVCLLAEEWVERTSGVFHPGIEPLVEVWNRAHETQVLPSEHDIEIALASIKTSQTKHLNLNGVAKGWIADRALDVALATGDGAVSGAWLSLGGDLVHRGDGLVHVGIEDPHRPYDNVAPLASIDISNQALATSGTGRRYWTIKGNRYSKVLDPRTGRPTSGVASATVVANTAATADALATTAVVLSPDETTRTHR